MTNAQTMAQSSTALAITDSFFAKLFVSEANAAVETSELSDVMKYMSKKFNAKILPVGTVCNGVVMDGGCDVTSCSVTTANVVQSTVSQGSGSLTCSAGYSGSPTYTCTAGTFTPGGSACAAITCSVSVTGVSSPSSVAYTPSSTSMSCNAAGYTGSVNYTCTTGTLNVTGSCTNSLYHGWSSPIGGCSTTSYNATASTALGGSYPYNSGDSNACRAWKLAATVCTSQPTLYSDTNNWQCPASGGFTDPIFGTYCASPSTQYSCSTCPGACNAQCSYNPLSLRNCSGAETNQP